MDNEPESPLEEATRLRQGPEAPSTLEPRVLAALRSEGLIRPRTTWPQPLKIAASLLIFAAGALAGHYALPGSLGPRPAPAQARYLLLLAGDVTPAADGSSRAAEYGDWARGLAARGITVSGEELAGHAQVVSNAKLPAFPELTSVGGYFLIEASDDASAAELARTSPHVRYGGSIVLRRIN
jgi:hypothetical protein